MGPRVGVLALQGDVVEHLAALRRLDVEAVRVRSAAELAACNGLVVPGGESTTIGRLAVRFGLMDALRSAVRENRPILGTCAGMVLLADRVLDATPAQRDGSELIGGLDVTVRRNAFGRQVDSFESSVAFGPVDRAQEIPAVFIRAPAVEEIGEGVEVLARWSPPAVGSAADAVGTGAGAGAGRIVAVRQGALIATAFHPEIGTDPVVHRLFVASMT